MGLGELDCAIRSLLSNLPQNRLSEDYPGTHNPIELFSFSKATDPFPPLFFDSLLGCPPALSVSEMTLLTVLASGFRLVI